MTRGVCSNCGAEMMNAATEGLCARCLLSAGLNRDFGFVDVSSKDLSAILVKPTTARGVKFHYFGDYELLEEIARGGMGVVFRARQVSLNRVVALKMIIAGHLAAPQAIERFHTEAKAAACLDHPHIVPIYEIGEHEGLHYFTMKLLEGGNLAQEVARGTIPSRRAAQLMADVARAVQHAHEHGVLHRDLKPNNILLDRDGTPHLTDFGLAKVVQSGRDASETAAILGTPAYIAPEQALGISELTPRADIYSLGVILYEMLSGCLPFDGNTPAETLRRIAEDDPRHLRSFNRGIDADLETICFKCLEKDPQRRYASAAALAEDLERWLRREPIAARPATAVFRARRWIERKPALTALIAVSAIVLAGFPVLVAKILRAREERRSFVSSVRAEKVRELQLLRKEWAKLDVPFVSISSELRSEIWKARSVATAPELQRERYVVGIYAHENPLETAGQFAPFLAWMETELSQTRTNRVRLDLRIYKDNRAARRALVHGAVDVVRLGAGPFFLAAEELAKEGKQAEVLARPRPGKYMAVIFTRADTGIRSIADLRGRSLALGNPESTISGFYAPAHLAQAGLHGDDMRFQFHRSHNQSVELVLGGKFDAGVAKQKLFDKEKRRGPGLIALTNIACTGMPWVARSGLAPDVTTQFRHCLLRLDKPEILSLIPDAPVEGFEAADAQEYAALRNECENTDRFLAGRDGELNSALAETARKLRTQMP